MTTDRVGGGGQGVGAERSRTRSTARDDPVKAADLPLVESHDQPRQVDEIAVGDLRGQRARSLDRTAGAQVAELLVQHGHLVVGRFAPAAG